MNKSAIQLKREELWNVWSHGVGLLLGIIGFVFLMMLPVCNTEPSSICSACCFGISLILVYASSTIYHLSKYFNHKLTDLLRTIDHINIYYLIAGTYSPFLLVGMSDSSGLQLFITVWSIATLGTIYKIFFKQKYPIFSLFLYLAMGWLIIFDIKNFFLSVPRVCFVLIVIGGIAYSIGTFFYSKEKIKFNHLYWHLFVLAGSGFHYAAVYSLYYSFS